MGEEKGVVSDVGEFVGYMFALLGYRLLDFVGFLPEEDFLQLSGFDGESSGEVLRIVELLPVAGIAESDDFFGEGVYGRHFGRVKDEW